MDWTRTERARRMHQGNTLRREARRHVHPSRVLDSFLNIAEKPVINSWTAASAAAGLGRGRGRCIRECRRKGMAPLETKGGNPQQFWCVRPKIQDQAKTVRGHLQKVW